MATKKKAVKKKRASVKRKAAEKTKLIKKILQYMVTDNGHSASASCRHVGVPITTFLDWVAADQELTARYERAHRAMVEMMADEIRDIADDGTNDYMEKLGEDGESLGYKLNGEHVQRSRLRVDSRKWLLSKIAQKKYGDKVDMSHGTQEGDPIRKLIDAVAGTHLQPKDDE